jgi:hypothetical protein
MENILEEAWASRSRKVKAQPSLPGLCFCFCVYPAGPAGLFS